MGRGSLTLIGDRMIEANSVSEAWLDAVELLARPGTSKAVHLVARIRQPTLEIEAIRHEADKLVASKPKLWPIDTTRNTLFPASWARRHPEPADLAAYYRSRYFAPDGLMSYRNNERGTYFGRIVAYPRGQGPPGDQLTDTVRKLRDEVAGSNKSSRYEINIYCESIDRNPISFPCLAHVSVHMHDAALHMQAVYRNEFLVARAYGNFLGLGQLQQYIATAAGLDLGELLMTINHVELDETKTSARAMLTRLSR